MTPALWNRSACLVNLSLIHPPPHIAHTAGTAPTDRIIHGYMSHVLNYIRCFCHELRRLSVLDALHAVGKKCVRVTVCLLSIPIPMSFVLPTPRNSEFSMLTIRNRFLVLVTIHVYIHMLIAHSASWKRFVCRLMTVVWWWRRSGPGPGRPVAAAQWGYFRSSLS